MKPKTDLRIIDTEALDEVHIASKNYDGSGVETLGWLSVKCMWLYLRDNDPSRRAHRRSERLRKKLIKKHLVMFEVVQGEYAGYGCIAPYDFPQV